MRINPLSDLGWYRSIFSLIGDVAVEVDVTFRLPWLQNTP